MARPTLIRLVIAAGSAAWDATIQSYLDAIAQFIADQPLALRKYTIASGANQLPAAADYEASLATITDPASGKGRLVVSDGTHWRYAGDDSIAL